MTVDMWVGVAMFGAAMFGLGLLAGWSLLFGTTIWAGKDEGWTSLGTPTLSTSTGAPGMVTYKTTMTPEEFEAAKQNFKRHAEPPPASTPDPGRRSP